MDKEIIKVTLFRNFTMSYQEETINLDEVATKQLATLLEILIFYHNQPISKDKLIEDLWQDSDNPSNVLKFSIFRLRKLLSTFSFLENMDLVKTTKQGYILNPEVPMEIDVHLVDRYWEKIKQKDITQKEMVEAAEAIIQLYKGQLFVDTTDQLWMIQSQSYYHSIFESCIERICETKLHDKDYEGVIVTAQKALTIDRYFENAYFFYIQALIESGQYKQALKIYKNVQNQFYQSVGQPLSLKMQSLYKIIISNDEQEEIDLDTLKNQLDSDLNTDGAFYCEYESFKHIYQVELRNSKRDHLKQFLIVFEISTDVSEEPLQKMMTKLTKIIQDSLRKGDVYSRINKTQVILLVPCETIDNGYMVIQRITQQFYRRVPKKQAKLYYHIGPIGTLETELKQNITDFQLQ